MSIPQINGGNLIIGGREVKARDGFLYSKAGVCMQGSGRLKDGTLVQCSWPGIQWENGMASASSRSQIRFSVGSLSDGLTEFKSVAAYLYSFRRLQRYTKLFIPELVNFLKKWDPATTGMLTVHDYGGGLINKDGSEEKLDLFVGEQKNKGENAYWDLMQCATPYPASGFWDRDSSCQARPPIHKSVDVYMWVP